MEQTPLPGIFIPCENLEALKGLILELYEKEILTDEDWQAVNVPPNFLEVMNDSSYFEKGEMFGFTYRKKCVGILTKGTDEIL